jgi:hypothetical protein
MSKVYYFVTNVTKYIIVCFYIIVVGVVAIVVGVVAIVGGVIYWLSILKDYIMFSDYTLFSSSVGCCG